MAEVDDYESDPDDAIVPSAMRRKEASDDERSDGGERRRYRTLKIQSDGESDGQGAYEEDQEDYGEEYEEEIEEEDEIVEDEEERRRDEKDLEVSRRAGEEEEDKEEGEEGEKKKENEPYAVPTAGAFYMHDDRFRESGRGRHRRMPGGRGLWESKDNRAWVHDRFEDMNLEDVQQSQGRQNSRGRFRGRGRGKTRGAGRGYAKGNNNTGGYYEDGKNQNRDSGTHDRTQKSVRGRGPRRYEPIRRNDVVAASQPKLLAKSLQIPHSSQESTASTSFGRQSSHTPNRPPDPALSRNHVFASNLNSASPPFYPSGSSKHDKSVNHKRDQPTGNTNKTISSSVQAETSFLSSQSNPMLRGKTAVDSVSPDRLYVDDSLHLVSGKALANSQVQSSGSPLARGNTSHSRVPARNLIISAQTNFSPTTSASQVPRLPSQIQPPVSHQRPQTQFQTALRVSTQQVGPQVSSPPRVPSANSSELGETNSPPGSSKSQTQLITKGKSSSNGAGRGSVLYSGTQVIGASGAIGVSQNDHNFSATPALLPVMQFGGQHHGGLGVPAVGMALPGYVAQPHLGFGNSEMTWIPVLAGAAGALGASYPYIALEGSYYPRPSGQTCSSVSSSRETSKPANTLKSPQRPEIVNDEVGQRHNKPRRYSEMNFGQ